jgi:hypothetical protein
VWTGMRMKISDFKAVSPLGFNPEMETLPNLISDVTKQVMENLIEKGYNPYVHDIDIRPVYSDTTGYATLQVRVFPRKARA